MTDLAVPVTEAFAATYQRLREQTSRSVETLWRSLEAYNDDDLDTWLTRIRPVASAATSTAASLAQGYVESVVGQALDVDHPALMNDPEWEDRYSGGLMRVWHGLYQGDQWDVAVDRGLREAQRITDTDVQSWMLDAAERSGKAAGRDVIGWRRVLSGSDTCDLCTVAATRIYKKGDLRPIHDHCNCSVAPVLRDADPGAEVNKDRAEIPTVNAAGFDASQLGTVTPDVDAVKADLDALYNQALADTAYRVDVSVVRMSEDGTSLRWRADIYDANGKKVGTMERQIGRLPDGSLAAEHSYFGLKADVQGQGLATRLNAAADEWYDATGVQYVRLEANIDVGGYAWARQGFDWDKNYYRADQVRELVEDFLVDIERAASELGRDVSAEASALRARLALDLTDPRFPTPYELSRVGYRQGDSMWPGKAGMLGQSWLGIRPVVP